MCFSSPSIPTPTQPQALQQPDNVNTLQRARTTQAGYGQQTVLTSPNGLTGGLNTGGSTLLGS